MNAKEYKDMIDPKPGLPLEYQRWERKRKKRAARIQKIDEFFEWPIVKLIMAISFFVCAFMGAVMLS